MKVSFSSAFKKSYQKRVEGQKVLETKFGEKLELFVHDPFHKSLRTHKLSGKLKDLWSFSIEYDMRVIFCFVAVRNLDLLLTNKLVLLPIKNLIQWAGNFG